MKIGNWCTHYKNKEVNITLGPINLVQKVNHQWALPLELPHQTKVVIDQSSDHYMFFSAYHNFTKPKIGSLPLKRAWNWTMYLALISVWQIQLCITVAPKLWKISPKNIAIKSIKCGNSSQVPNFAKEALKYPCIILQNHLEEFQDDVTDWFVIKWLYKPNKVLNLVDQELSHQTISQYREWRYLKFHFAGSAHCLTRLQMYHTFLHRQSYDPNNATGNYHFHSNTL